MPEECFHFDKDMAQIASYLTFDGHLYNDLSGFYLSSKNIGDLRKFEEIIKNKFRVQGKYYLNNGGCKKCPTHKFIVFNKLISKRLFESGIPKGDKVSQEFEIPFWITSSKELSREYLKIAFLCEGSYKENLRKNPRIQFNIAKTEEFLESGIKFINTLKEMLKRFDIKTTQNYISGQRLRKKDNKLSKDIRFRILTKNNNKFINQIGWIK